MFGENCDTENITNLLDVDFRTIVRIVDLQVVTNFQGHPFFIQFTGVRHYFLDKGLLP